jgi:hypothetical protein
MKPLHVALLIAAGAVGGAVVMQVWQRPEPAAAPAPAVAKVQEPAAAPVAAVPEAPPVAAPAIEPAPGKPAVVKERRTAKKPATKPVVVAKNEPSAVAPPVEPPKEIQPVPTTPPPTPPARTEPENVTPPPPPPPPEPRRVTLNAGILIPVRLVEGLSTERNSPGDTFTATLDRQLVVDGYVIAERGARVDGRVVDADRGGRVKGVAAIAVELTRLRTADGQNIAIQTESFAREAESSRRDDATKVGAGAAVGAIIGAIAGGGKGAAIGAGAGGAAGAGTVALTRGKPATLPSETRIDFRLKAPVSITEKIYH